MPILAMLRGANLAAERVHHELQPVADSEDGPPERIIPAGECLRISSILELQGRTTENTLSSRTRRAISCEYCAPKSRTTIDWVSTDEFLRSELPCKARLRLQEEEHRSELIHFGQSKIFWGRRRLAVLLAAGARRPALHEWSPDMLSAFRCRVRWQRRNTLPRSRILRTASYRHLTPHP